MTTVQTLLLIESAILISLIAWIGYQKASRTGGLRLQSAEPSSADNDCEIVRELKRSLHQCRANHQELYKHCDALERDFIFGPKEEKTLLEIAEKLRLSAQTFSAFETGEKLQRDCQALSEKAHHMAMALRARERRPSE